MALSMENYIAKRKYTIKEHSFFLVQISLLFLLVAQLNLHCYLQQIACVDECYLQQIASQQYVDECYLQQIACVDECYLQQIAMCGCMLSTVDSNVWTSVIYSRQQCVDECYLQQIAMCGCMLSTVDSNVWTSVIYSRQQCVDECNLKQIAMCG